MAKRFGNQVTRGTEEAVLDQSCLHPSRSPDALKHLSESRMEVLITGLLVLSTFSYLLLSGRVVSSVTPVSDKCSVNAA